MYSEPAPIRVFPQTQNCAVFAFRTFPEEGDLGFIETMSGENQKMIGLTLVTYDVDDRSCFEAHPGGGAFISALDFEELAEHFGWNGR